MKSFVYPNVPHDIDIDCPDVFNCCVIPMIHNIPSPGGEKNAYGLKNRITLYPWANQFPYNGNNNWLGKNQKYIPANITYFSTGGNIDSIPLSPVVINVILPRPNHEVIEWITKAKNIELHIYDIMLVNKKYDTRNKGDVYLASSTPEIYPDHIEINGALGR